MFDRNRIEYAKCVFLLADPSRINKDASVLIVGTGLSMADVVVSLARHGHEGRVTAISRRGIIPKSHDTGLLFSLACGKMLRWYLLDAFSNYSAHHSCLNPGDCQISLQFVGLGALNFDFPEKKRSALELSYEMMEKIAHHTSLVNLLPCFMIEERKHITALQSFKHSVRVEPLEGSLATDPRLRGLHLVAFSQ